MGVQSQEHWAQGAGGKGLPPSPEWTSLQQALKSDCEHFLPPSQCVPYKFAVWDLNPSVQQRGLLGGLWVTWVEPLCRVNSSLQGRVSLSESALATIKAAVMKQVQPCAPALGPSPACPSAFHHELKQHGPTPTTLTGDATAQSWTSQPPAAQIPGFDFKSKFPL